MKLSESLLVAAVTLTISHLPIARGDGNINFFHLAGSLGNLTQVIESYYTPIVHTGDPTCKAQILSLSQDPAVIGCYPLAIESQMFDVSPPDFATLDDWTGRFCSSGCNDLVRRAAGAMYEACPFKKVVDETEGGVFDVETVKKMYVAFGEARYETTCLKSEGGGGYCFPIVYQNLTDAGIDVMKQDPSTLPESAGVLCSSDCGQKIIHALGSVFPTVAPLCDPSSSTISPAADSTPVASPPAPPTSDVPAAGATPTPTSNQIPPPPPSDTSLAPPPPESTPNPIALTRRSHARAFAA